MLAQTLGSGDKLSSKIGSEGSKTYENTATQHGTGDPFTLHPLLGSHFGTLFGTQDLFFGLARLFEGSNFGFRFGVCFNTHFATENSLQRKPKRQEKQQKAREAKTWFGCGRRYTGGT